MPRLYIISGCNGAGKTTASYSLLPEMLDCKEFVNSDEFAKGLSPFDPSKASIQASRYMLLKIRYLLRKEQDKDSAQDRKDSSGCRIHCYIAVFLAEFT